MEEPLVKCKVWKVQQNFNMFINITQDSVRIPTSSKGQRWMILPVKYSYVLFWGYALRKERFGTVTCL